MSSAMIMVSVWLAVTVTAVAVTALVVLRPSQRRRDEATDALCKSLGDVRNSIEWLTTQTIEQRWRPLGSQTIGVSFRALVLQPREGTFQRVPDRTLLVGDRVVLKPGDLGTLYVSVACEGNTVLTHVVLTGRYWVTQARVGSNCLLDGEGAAPEALAGLLPLTLLAGEKLHIEVEALK